MSFEEWWSNIQNRIEFDAEPDDYSKAKFVFESALNGNENDEGDAERESPYVSFGA